jgi:hypothetical protein
MSVAFCDVTSWGSIPTVTATTMSKPEIRTIEIVPEFFDIVIFIAKIEVIQYYITIIATPSSFYLCRGSLVRN